MFALTKFHRFIHKQITDHCFWRSKKALPIHTANRLQQWGTVLLNYNFRMESLTPSKLCHMDRLSRLSPKNSEPLEDRVIATSRSRDKKYTMQYCVGTTCDFGRNKNKGLDDNFIVEMKKKLK